MEWRHWEIINFLPCVVCVNSGRYYIICWIYKRLYKNFFTEKCLYSIATGIQIMFRCALNFVCLVPNCFFNTSIYFVFIDGQNWAISLKNNTAHSFMSFRSKEKLFSVNGGNVFFCKNIKCHTTPDTNYHNIQHYIFLFLRSTFIEARVYLFGTFTVSNDLSESQMMHQSNPVFPLHPPRRWLLLVLPETKWRAL